MEHKVCKGCQYNNYPTCKGIIMIDGNEMGIDNLRDVFQCGQKDEEHIVDFSIKRKTDLELRIEALEEKTKDLNIEPK